jgi:hypothetical protein
MPENIPDPKTGYRTTEFWTWAITVIVLPVLAVIFHKDFSDQVPIWAAAAAGLATAVYIISRTFVKSAYARAPKAAAADKNAEASDKEASGQMSSIHGTVDDLTAKVKVLEDQLRRLDMLTSGNGQSSPGKGEPAPTN